MCFENRSLIVADILHGILRIDNIAPAPSADGSKSGTEAPSVTKLVSKGTRLNDVPITGVNGIALLPDGRVVASDIFPGRDSMEMFQAALEANPIGRCVNRVV